MKPLTKDQIESVVQWLNSWDQLKDGVIPIRFKEYYTGQLQKTKPSNLFLAPSLEKRLDFASELAESIDGDMPVSAILATTYWMQAEMINLNKDK